MEMLPIKMADEVIVGAEISVSIPLTSVGWLRALDIDAEITVPSISGYTVASLIPNRANTFRFHPTSIAISGGKYYADGYISGTNSTPAVAYYVPVYKKS